MTETYGPMQLCVTVSGIKFLNQISNSNEDFPKWSIVFAKAEQGVPKTDLAGFREWKFRAIVRS